MTGQVAQRIVAEAARLFGERGTADTSLRDIARAAGVALSQLHYYFGSRQALVDAVRRTCWDGYVREIRTVLESVADGPGAPAAVTAAVDRFREIVCADPAPFRLCLDLRLLAAADEDGSRPARAVHRELIDLLAMHLQRLGLDAGDAPGRARMALAVLDGLLIQTVVDGDTPDVRHAYRRFAAWLTTHEED